MEGHKTILGIVDYLVIVVMLLISAGIGVYFRFAGRKQKTAQEYLLAGKNMGILPVTFSLMASFISATSVLGIPAEMYRYGTQYALKGVGLTFGIILSSFIFLPVFFQIQAPSTYEYIERRFGKPTRNICSFFFVIQSILYMSIVLYAPGLALSAVTNLSIWVSVISIGTVCTFYSTLGGMKAVLWTDVFQGVLMFLTLFAAIIRGCIALGGVTEVFKIANEGGRILLPGAELDPKVRYTILNVLLQGAFAGLSGYGTGQVQVQRLLTIKTLERSRMAMYLSAVLWCAFLLMNCFTGIVIFAYYAKCNPMTSPNKPISSADQLLPYFIMSTLSHYPGLAGLCIAGIFSASLSTVSSVINSLSAVTTEDVVRPLFASWRISEAKIAVSAKVVTVFYGLVCLCLTVVVSKFGNLIQITMTIYNLINVPIMGVFFLGMMTQRSNEKGVVVGLLTSIALTMWISFASALNGPPPTPLPVSIEECSSSQFPYSSVLAYSVVPNRDDYVTKDIVLPTNATILSAKDSKDTFYLYKISFMWYPLISFVTCVTIGYLSSILFSLFMGKTKSVSGELLSPVFKLIFRKPFSKEKELIEM